MLIYSVLIHKDADSDYGASVPDVPGCVSAGSSPQEALQEIHEALQCHLEGMVMDGEDLPVPSFDIPPEEMQGDWGDGGLVSIGMAAIDPNSLSSETERFNVVLPKWLVKKISLYPENRSEFLTKAATEEVQRRMSA